MRLWVLVLPLLLAGCAQSLLREAPGSTLAFACAVMDPVQGGGLVVESWLAPGSSPPVGPVVDRLVVVLAHATGRSEDSFIIRSQTGPAPPEGGWTRARLHEYAEPVLRYRTTALRVLWVDSMAEPSTGMVAGPGMVVVALDSVAAGAHSLGRPFEAVAFAVLLHQVGHALGLVNQGIPVQDPDIQEREGPPGHNRDPASVLNAAWDDARTLSWASNATYDGFLAADLADLAAARRPGGVCT